ncbi:hypothetical protein F7725_010806 [Dissostichus mawsoni]|uniref:C1q domain-containing protein n=1 Tax=Dissostichus mawsoni TaxID=36200 RepID=A0A7J5Z770_DISMA|nr:hypothetical protein F7725_010806 [Dissostichus mawsoni]
MNEASSSPDAVHTCFKHTQNKTCAEFRGKVHDGNSLILHQKRLIQTPSPADMPPQGRSSTAGLGGLLLLGAMVVMMMVVVVEASEEESEELLEDEEEDSSTEEKLQQGGQPAEQSVPEDLQDLAGGGGCFRCDAAPPRPADSELSLQRGRSFNSSTGRYAAPLTGFYQLTASLLIESGDRVQVRLRDSVRAAICIESLCQSNLSVESVMGVAAGGGTFSVLLTGTLYLQAGEYVSVFLDNATGSSSASCRTLCFPASCWECERLMTPRGDGHISTGTSPDPQQFNQTESPLRLRSEVTFLSPMKTVFMEHHLVDGRGTATTMFLWTIITSPIFQRLMTFYIKSLYLFVSFPSGRNIQIDLAGG